MTDDDRRRAETGPARAPGRTGRYGSGAPHARGGARGRAYSGQGRRPRPQLTAAVAGVARDAAVAGRDRVPTRAIRNCSGRRHATWRAPAAGRVGSPRDRCSASGPTVVGEQIAEHADADVAARRGADRGRRIDGVGHAAADGAGAAAGQDRGGGRRRCGDLAEDHRAGRPRRGARAGTTSPAAGRATPTDEAALADSPESRENAAILVLKRQDAPSIEKFRARRI